MLEHGGRLIAAAKSFGISQAEWLDLSAALNPESYLIPTIPSSVWWRLPENEDKLLSSAEAYFGTTHFLPVPGTQAAIQFLPTLLEARLGQNLRVGYVSPTYNEHPHAWNKAGHTLVSLQSNTIDSLIDTVDILILVNPNNPTGELYSNEDVKRWHSVLSVKGAYLIVDEAFIDATPEHSMLDMAGASGLIILRSLGKFFGLAGARVGFIFAPASLLSDMQEALGPWPISHPSRFVASAALADSLWHDNQRTLLQQKSARLCALLTQQGFTPSGGSALFQWVEAAQAEHLYTSLARQGILIRYYEDTSSVRFGLPATETDWLRLKQALSLYTS